ncbi:fimbrial assembly protein [Salinibacterium sp. NK8237]|uniref:fimbrial assembly protein n=1 Tax=Salinibacterium sp. NK8237 TaxID=2792038 RepID=UPI0018CCE7F0|nr:fimbrial assembly protein [Salinibacterium sp. NK8237]MBH0129936.1 fimbrial assembly protein [Salinibacterium sp. NK8237]
MSEKKPVTRREVKVPFGYPPLVSLLPPEVGERKAAASARGRAIFVALIALGIAVLVAVGANIYQLQRAATLENARSLTLSLIEQQGQYEEVRVASAQLKSAEAAQLFITSTEISTETLIKALDAQLSSGMTITAYSLQTANPLQVFAESLSPIEPDSIGLLSVSVTAPTLAAIDVWLRKAPTIDGLLDGSVTQISANEDDGSYAAIVSVFVGDEALLHRFEEIPEDAETAESTSEEETG